MLFWLLAALLTSAVTLATVLPLFRPGATLPNRAQYDEEIFRAQLKELGDDEARGVIRAEDAAVARAEIGRRLLKLRAASAGSHEAVASRRGGPAVLAGLAVALLLPAGAFLFYDRAGSPEIGDLPLASREREAPQADFAAMIAQIERRLAERPDDGVGWGVIAPVYLQLGEADKAIGAFRNAIRLTGPTTQKLAGLGEALVQGAEGEVTGEAEAEFRRALDLDPTWESARFYLALKLSQESRLAEAETAWADLLRTGAADAPWRPIAEAALADARAKQGRENAVAEAPPGPGAADIAAADELSPEDRTAMIDAMVSQLAARLKTAPNDPEGWKRLIRSYAVLGDDARARSAVGEAQAAFPQGSDERMDIERFARSLAIGMETTRQ